MSQVATLGLVLVLIIVVGAAGLAAGWLAWDDRAPARATASVAQPNPATPKASPTTPATTTPTPTTPTPFEGRDFAELYDDVASGVLMVRATTCEGTGVGTAFHVTGNRVVTAAHVVDEAAAVAVASNGVTYEATVLGVDIASDLAVLQLSEEFDGHVFDIGAVAPEAGESLAVIGHPLGDPLTITVGATSRVDAELWPQFQLDVSISPGNSGGPVVRGNGDIVGMILSKDTEAEGLGYALSAERITTGLTNPETLTEPVPADCSRPLGPEDAEPPEVSPLDDLHIAIASTFDNYFTAINIGEYELAFDQLAPRLRDGMTVDDFSAAVWTSFDFGFEVHDVTETADGAVVWLEFTSLQDPEYGPEGESCTDWSLDYELVWSEGRLLINRATGHDGSAGHRPCA